MGDFWDFIFEGGKGYVYVAFLDKKTKDFKQQFLAWPEQKQQLRELPRSYRDRGDLYFCPAFFKERSGKKRSVLGSRVAWVDLDRPGAGPDGPQWALVASGTPGHRHAYVRADLSSRGTDGLLAPFEIEAWNIQLFNKYGGDPSGIDCCQLLRVPETYNYKSDPRQPVKLLQLGQVEVLPPNFDELPKKFEQIEIQKESALSTLAKHNLDIRTRQLILGEVEILNRSDSLFELASRLAENNLKPGEIYGLLEFADAKWGKFSQRDDKELRLQEIVDRVAIKRPGFKMSFDIEVEKTPLVGWKSVGKRKKEIKWVVPGVLRERGLLVISGSTGVGKTTLAMNLSAKIGLATPQASSDGTSEWFGEKITKGEHKILYSSLEMDEEEVNYFLGKMNGGFNGDEQDILEDRVTFFPHGQPYYIDTAEVREDYEKKIADEQFTGVVIDTLGASISGALSEEKTMRQVADWIDHVRQTYGVWVVLLHHPRKEQQGKRNIERTADDLYGSRIIGDRANSILELRKVPKSNDLQLIAHKTRFRQGGSYKFLTRTEHFWLVESEKPTITNGQANGSAELTADEFPEGIEDREDF